MFKVGDRVKRSRQFNLTKNTFIGTVMSVDFVRNFHYEVLWNGQVHSACYEAIELELIMEPNDIMKELLDKP